MATAVYRMNVEDINRLIYNPIWTGRLLHFFLSGASQSTIGKVKFELLYYVHPLLYDDVVLERLIASNSRTTLSNLMSDERIRVQLAGIGPKVNTFREVTNKALVVTGKNVEFLDGGYVKTSDPIKYLKYSDPNTRGHFKAAQNLGSILAKENHIEAILRLCS